MSSKLHQGGDAEGLQRVVWRRAGGSSSRGPENPPEPKADVQALVEAAHRKGYAAGELAGATLAGKRATEQMTPAIARLGALVQELAGLRAQVRKEAEQGTVRLALAIARRVLHRELATDPEALVGLVRSALDRLNAREIHRLRLCATDAELVAKAGLRLPPAVEVAADPGLAPGCVVFETARGEVDASIGTQLDEIERGLTDVMRRR
jgi:flagellar assembly protein FliH